MTVLKALGLAVVVGLIVYILGALLTTVTVDWVKSLGTVLEGLSGLVALVAFIYILVVGTPSRGV